MSRDYITDPAEDSAFSLRRIDNNLDQVVVLLERIAVALERAHPVPTEEDVSLHE